MIRGVRCLIVVVLCCASGGASGKGTADAQAAQKVWIRGHIRTADGSPVSGVEVRCFEIDPKYSYEFVWQQGTAISDDRGQYAFSVLGDREYRIAAGGIKSTFGRSERFVAHTNEAASVEDIIVVPATGLLKGQILNADGSPASGLLYSCQSESFRPYAPFDYPQTDANGGFHLEVLPDEDLSLWVVPGPNQVQMWTGLPPGSDARVVRLDPEAFIDLPPEWKVMSDIEALARQRRGTRVGERIALTLPDLDGRLVSLPSARFEGKVVLVNLFGTWCGGCRVEMPHLVDLKEKYGPRGLEIVGIAFEREPEETARATVRQFVEERKANYPILFGGQERRTHVLATIEGLERFSGYPTTIFIGRDGTVKEVKVGFKGESPERIAWQTGQFEKIIVRLLNEPVEGR
jgi:thiol-disulfide isomerase/thioredoxin